MRRGPQGAGVRVGASSTSYGSTSEVDFVPPSEVDLMDVSPKQIVSISTALIPFIEHDDANRALMGANMQKQAVPLVRPEAPYIGTGVEARAAQDAGDVLMAEGKGTVTEVSGDHITVEYNDGQKDALGHNLGRKVYRLLKFQRSNQNTAINQRVAHRAKAPRSTRAICSPTARRPTTVSSRSARTCSSRSCRGRATTTKTPSS